MPVSNGHITAPVSIANVRSAIGSGSSDLGTLCKSDSINKWAKYKPVRAMKISALTAVEFKMTPAVGSYQTRYGLKCFAPGEVLSSVHNCNYEYYRPYGGPESPFRLTDFNGYVHNGQPEFLGDPQFGASVDPSSGSLTLALRMNYNSSGGVEASNNCVSLYDMMGYASLSSLTGCYVCCLVSGTNTSTGEPASSVNWAVCCRNVSVGSQTPISHGGATYYLFDAPLSSANSAMKIAGKHLVSFFLVQSQGQIPLPSWASWTSIGSTQIIGNTWIAIPGAAGIQVTFATAADNIIVNSFGVIELPNSGTGVKVSASLSYSFRIGDGAFSEGQTVSVGVTIKAGSATLLDRTDTRTVTSDPVTLVSTYEFDSAPPTRTATATITCAGSSVQESATF